MDDYTALKKLKRGLGLEDLVVFHKFDFEDVLRSFGVDYLLNKERLNILAANHVISFHLNGELRGIWQTDKNHKQWFIKLEGVKIMVGVLHSEDVSIEKNKPLFGWINGICTKYTHGNFEIQREATLSDTQDNYSLIMNGFPQDVANLTDDQITAYMNVRKKMNESDDVWKFLETLGKTDIIDMKKKYEVIGNIYNICKNMKTLKNY